MAQSTINLMVTSDHVIPLNVTGAQATITVAAGGIVYYSDNPQVSSTQYLGSISATGSATITGPAWIIGTKGQPAAVQVTEVDEVVSITLPASVLSDARLSSAAAGQTPVKQSDGGWAPAAVSASTSSTTVSTTPPVHVETWAYDDQSNGGASASTSLVQKWVTYPYTNDGFTETKAITDAAGSSLQPAHYIDCNWQWSTGGMLYPAAIAAASENWWLHQAGFSDSAHRVTGTSFGTGYMLNQSNASVRAWLGQWAANHIDSYPVLMMDDTAGNLSSQLFGSGVSTSQEITTDAALQAAHRFNAATMLHSNGSPFLQVNNGIDPNPFLPRPWSMFQIPSHVIGFVMEGHPWNAGFPSWFSSTLDDMAYLCGAYSSGFIVLLSYETSVSGRQAQARRVHAATVLLGYQPGRIVSWANLEKNTSSLAVWPESGLYPVGAVQSMGKPDSAYGSNPNSGTLPTTGGHNDLLVGAAAARVNGTNGGISDSAGGVYRREFRMAYNQGVPIGPLAAIVNDTDATVTILSAWLTQTYGHQVTWVGGDVQAGGTIDLTSTTFTAGTTTLAANDAILLVA